jgi:hypothetical protein
MVLLHFLFLLCTLFLFAEKHDYSLSSHRCFVSKWQAQNAHNDSVDKALAQSYRFLGMGEQSSAFVSDDGNYVIKFFKNRLFSVASPRFSIPFYSEWDRRKKTQKKALRRDHIYSTYRHCCDRLSQETGIFYVHFNTTDTLQKTLRLSENASCENAFIVNLDECDFVLQRRAIGLKEYLNSLLEQGRISEAVNAIDRLMQMPYALYKNGMRDRDIVFINNYGFIEDKPVLFDVGRLFPAHGELGRKKMEKKAALFMSSIYSWIKANYPELTLY